MYFIPFFLDYCISVVVLPRSVVCSWGFQDQHSWCGLPKVVCFLRGSRSLLWCVMFVIWFWLHSGLPSGFLGLDVALSVRVNQYKSVCVMTSQSLHVPSCEICHWVTCHCVVLDQTLFLEDWKPLNANEWYCFLRIYKLICSCFSSQKQPIATCLAGFQICQKSHSVFWFFLFAFINPTTSKKIKTRAWRMSAKRKNIKSIINLCIYTFHLHMSCKGLWKSRVILGTCTMVAQKENLQE